MTLDSKEKASIWHQPRVIWGSLVIILLVALLIRAPLVPDLGYKGDLEHFAVWVSKLRTDGLFGFYNKQLRFALWDRVYPPIATLAFEGVSMAYPPPITSHSYTDSALISLIKVAPLIAELGLIAAAYVWLKDRKVLRYVVAGLFALYPGLIATTAWWGQYDAPYTLFLVLALMALNKDRPILSWVFFGISILLKQPGIVLSVALLVPTVRRYGWKTTLASILACGLVNLIFYIPFFIGSGVYNSISPYLEAGDVFPFLANNAYNFWFILIALHKGSMPVAFDPTYSDHQKLLNLFMYRDVGRIMFLVYIVLLIILMWKQKDQRREFVWATALYYGLFMLPTQIHERYLYAGAVFALLAAVQDRRMWWVAIGLIWTYSYNVIGVAIPYTYQGLDAGTGFLAFPTALMNVILFIMTVRITLFPKPDVRPNPVEQPASAPLALSAAD